MHFILFHYIQWDNFLYSLQVGNFQFFLVLLYEEGDMEMEDANNIKCCFREPRHLYLWNNHL